MFFQLAQTALIFPGAMSQGNPDAQVQPASGEELVQLTTATGQRVVALFGKAIAPDGRLYPDDARRPTLVFFYGNGMCLASARDLIELFRTAGVNVLVPDYLGFGMSGGTPSEAGCYETADAAYAWLPTRTDVDKSRIIAGGWSLGAAVAVDLASRKPTAGVMMLSPFTSMVDMGKHLYPFLPVSTLLKHRFESLRKIPNVHCPIMIGHGAADDMIPAAMTEQLAAAAGGPADKFIVPRASHNDFVDIGQREIMEHFARLIAQVMQR